MRSWESGLSVARMRRDEGEAWKCFMMNSSHRAVSLRRLYMLAITAQSSTLRDAGFLLCACHRVPPKCEFYPCPHSGEVGMLYRLLGPVTFIAPQAASATVGLLTLTAAARGLPLMVYDAEERQLLP